MKRAGIFLGAAVAAFAGWNACTSYSQERREGRRISERATRGFYARLRAESLQGGPDAPALETLQKHRALFLEACRACAAAKRCEAEARQLDEHPELARLAAVCP